MRGASCTWWQTFLDESLLAAAEVEDRDLADIVGGGDVEFERRAGAQMVALEGQLEPSRTPPPPDTRPGKHWRIARPVWVSKATTLRPAVAFAWLRLGRVSGEWGKR